MYLKILNNRRRSILIDLQLGDTPYIIYSSRVSNFEKLAQD